MGTCDGQPGTERSSERPGRGPLTSHVSRGHAGRAHGPCGMRLFQKAWLGDHEDQVSIASSTLQGDPQNTLFEREEEKKKRKKEKKQVKMGRPLTTDKGGWDG